MPSPAGTAELEAAPPTARYRRYVLGVLVIVYTLNFVDRQVLAILATPIKAALGLSDSQVGLMAGLAFAALYSTLALPIAWLADRGSRRQIMTWAIALWSAFTVICGFAGSFLHLFLARIGVGIGEAGGVAPAYSMIADYFPKEQRARALSVYSLGIPLGGAFGILLGGLIAHAIGWRAAFVIVGSVGVVVAPLFRLTVRDPKRGGYDPAPVAAPVSAKPRFLDVFRLVSKKSTFWLLAFGAAASSVCGYGLAFWLPSFFDRTLGLTLVERSWYYAGITLIGGCLGILGGGVLADRLGKASRRAYPLIPAIAFLIGLPCFFFAVNTSIAWLAFLLFVIPTGLNLMWLGPIVTAVQHLVPAHMRTMASAMFLLINNLIGIAIGLYYFGAVSDALAPRYGKESLHYAIYTGLGFYLIAAVLFVLASRKIKKHWVEG
jgi:predicted MFS family arabinose efflux permease